MSRWPYRCAIKTLKGTIDRCFIWSSSNSGRTKKSVCCSELSKPRGQNYKLRTRIDLMLIGWIMSSCWNSERTQGRSIEGTTSMSWAQFQHQNGKILHPPNLTSAKYAWKLLKQGNNSRSWGVGMSMTLNVLIHGSNKRSVVLSVTCHLLSDYKPK